MATIHSKTFSKDFIFEVSKGNVPGHKIVATTGFSSIIDTTTRILWSESVPYVLPTVAGGMTISSDSAQDVSGGTGVFQIIYQGLDINFDPLSLDTRGFPGGSLAILNGTTPVSLPSSLFRINALFALGAAGNSGVNIGNVYIGTGTVTDGKPAVVLGKINAGVGFENVSRRTVPNNYTLISIDIQVAVEASKSFSFRLSFESSQGNFFDSFPFIVGDGISVYRRPRSFPATGGMTVFLDVSVSQQTGTCQATEESILVHKDYINL